MASAKSSTHSLQHKTSKVTLSPPTTATVQRSLRRKKRMTMLRQRSSCSLRSRFQSQDITPTQAPLVRLGHPTRPYYTAIRKNMSRPNSPNQNQPPSRSPSPTPSYVPSSMLPLYIPRPSLSEEMSQRRTSLPPVSHTVGFSFSGETELRIALARARSNDDEVGYRFREMPSSPQTYSGRKNGSVSRRVKKLSKGIKELVLGCS